MHCVDSIGVRTSDENVPHIPKGFFSLGLRFWPDCKAISAYGLMMSVCPSVCLSVRVSVNIWLTSAFKVFLYPRNEFRGVYWNHPVRPSVCPSVCRRARLGKIARLGIGCRGGCFVPLGQPHSSFSIALIRLYTGIDLDEIS